MIGVQDLGVRYGPGLKPAVQHVGFTVARGASFGLVGESGCGKSTVLRVLAGLHRQYRGIVSLDGEVLPAQRPRAFFRRVQMVFQDPYGSLHPRQTVRTQLLEPLRNQALGRAEERVAAAMAAVRIDPGLSYRFPHQLSGGQRQRVAIARALVLEPEVLLLDEPTSALDVSVQAEILNLFADLRAQRGLTYILVSHDLAVVAHLCDHLAVMRDGEIVEHLNIDSLRRGEASHPYTRQLLAASEAYGEAPGPA